MTNQLSKELLTQCINNSRIVLTNTDDLPTGKKFQSRFIIPGVAGYPGQFGNVLITKESLDKFVKTLETRPVIIQHQTVTDENVKDLEVGRVHNVWFNEKDGWYWCDGVITSDEAIDLINKGWSVSCSYNVLLADDKGGTENNIPYDMEFLDGVFTHLAIVNNPRYERANIVFNSKTVLAPIEIDITNEVKSNKEIQFLNGLKEILENLTEPTQEDLRVLNGLNEIFNNADFEEKHKRIPKGNPNGGQFTKNDGTSNIKPKLRDYNKYLQIHKTKGLIDKYPNDFLGTTDEEIENFLGIKENKPAIFTTPIETVKIYKNNIPHIRHEKDKTRLLGLNRAIKTLQNPNIIIQDKKENYYIKFFDKQGKNKAHLQVIKTTKKGGFYKTNFPMSKNKFEKLEGQVIYDLSSKR